MSVYLSVWCELALQVDFIVLLSVTELHKNPEMEETHKQLNKKFDHLVFGPAAGQGLSNRLQCEGCFLSLYEIVI